MKYSASGGFPKIPLVLSGESNETVQTLITVQRGVRPDVTTPCGLAACMVVGWRADLNGENKEKKIKDLKTIYKKVL